MWWSDLFTNMNPTDFFNFSFLPKYGTAFVRGIEYTLLLAVVSVLLAILPALGLALMRRQDHRRHHRHLAGPLHAGGTGIFLYQLSGLQGHRGHRKEDASWRQAITHSSPSGS